jgi:outer membrane lipoprotein-sorting protein
MKNLLLFLAALLLSVPALADDNADIRKAEEYLRSFHTARARFVQTTHTGVQLVGTFYLERPGKLRFQYDPPIEDFVVADGFFIYFYDAENDEQTNAPIGQTLADFILRENIMLSGDVKVTEVKHSGGLLQITLVQTEDPEAGSILLGFEEDPFQLKKWRITDAQGLITEVELFYMKSGVTHPVGLFSYQDPNKGKKPKYNQ